MNAFFKYALMLTGSILISTYSYGSGTLSLQSIDTNGSSWTMISSSPPTLKVGSSIMATDSDTNVSSNSTGYLYATFQYVCDPTDIPPSTVTMSYSSSSAAYLQYNMLANPSPSGAVSGSYNVKVIRVDASGSNAETDLIDSFGPISQATTPKGAGLPPQSCSFTAHVVGTPVSAWTLTSTGTQFTWTIRVYYTEGDGTLHATCTTPPRAGVNFAATNWNYTVQIGGFSVH